MLLDLVSEAESPLYSAYRWLGRQLGHDLSLTAYLSLVEELITKDAIQLWSVDPATHERLSVDGVPADLEQRYWNLGPLEDDFDPFGLSITLGSSVDPATEPEWEIDLDLEAKTFVLRATPGSERRALEQLARLFPDLRLDVQHHRFEVRGVVRVRDE
jgi:hypothetical protein